MERQGILAAGNMLVEHVHNISDWPRPGWLSEITCSEKSTGGSPLNVLLTLAKMKVSLPLAAIGLVDENSDGDLICRILDAHGVDNRRVRRTALERTSMSQVMTEPGGQRTFFYAPGANRRLDLDAFAGLNTRHRIFHLGYLLLLERLDSADERYGTRSARLLAAMQRQGYLTSLDLVSRQGGPHYREQVLPALRWLDYLIINELEAGEFTGLALRDERGGLVEAIVAEVADQLQRLGVRRRVVIHAPEGAWGQEPGQPCLWLPSWRLSARRIVGSVGAGDAFCAGVLYGSHQCWPLAETLRLGHTCANFCLRAANAIDGIRPLAAMQAEMARCASGDAAGEERRAGPGDVGCENIA
ncbi:carbohydrate kinase family protein [Sodalis sp.]|uniref:carbohydrate kinase family protein n=1 Tax=Sodalis sp. (in: enterobacteria) TaxID=1898979 RepID=UPI003872F0BA